MTSDSGLTKQDSDYARQIQEALDELQHMQETVLMASNVGKSVKVAHKGFSINKMAHYTPRQSCKQSKTRSMHL